MTRDEVTRAAMYLLARRQGIGVRNKATVEREWIKWHACVHNALRSQVREAARALAWAARSGPAASEPKR